MRRGLFVGHMNCTKQVLGDMMTGVSCAGLVLLCLCMCVGCRAVLCCVLQDPRDDVSGEKLVADDMLQFLQEFFEGGRGEVGEDITCGLHDHLLAAFHL